MHHPPPGPPARLLSLDAYRGFIMVCLCFNGFGIAKMAELKLKDHPDSGWWRFLYKQWEHGQWSGWGFWDLIMPSFMFMVGTSMAFSLARRQREGDSWWKIGFHVLLRAVLLIVLGIFLMYHGKPTTAWTLVNTLSQIGLCYPLVFLCWGRGFRIQTAIAFASLVVSWLIIIAYGGTNELGPGVTAEWAAEHHSGIGPAWRKNANAFHAFDTWFLNAFPRKVPFEYQDGGYQTLNFLPSLFTMIVGLMCGELARLKDLPHAKKLWIMLTAGIALLVMGQLLGMTGSFPIVKRIWTPSFSLVCTGSCLLMLSAFFWVVDIAGWTSWTKFFIVAGSNSLALYVMSMLLKKWTGGLWERYLGAEVFLWAGPSWEPVLRACAVGFSFWLVCLWMYANKFFVKI